MLITLNRISSLNWKRLAKTRKRVLRSFTVNGRKFADIKEA